MSSIRSNSNISGTDLLRGLVLRPGSIDPDRLLECVVACGGEADLDPRDRLLLRDSMRALTHQLGRATVLTKLRRLGAESRLTRWTDVDAEDSRGYPSIERRLMKTTDPESVMAMLRDLGRRVREPSSLVIGGSIALILEGLIVHTTEDVDVVDELPEVIRRDHALLAELVARHGLRLTHFQSHYLPEGWSQRTHCLGRFGAVDVRVVDSIDMLVCKLFSRRAKDFVHLKAAWGLIDQAVFRDRLCRSTRSYRDEPRQLDVGTHNWYVLTGEPDLPPLIDDGPTSD